MRGWVRSARSGVPLLYSNGTMTSLGVTGLDIPSRWQILSTVEAVNAMLLFGISTAFIFAMLQDYWPLLSQAPRKAAAQG